MNNSSPCLRGLATLALGLFLLPAMQLRAGSILREVFEGIGGTSLGDLTSSPRYPGNPTSTNYVTDFFESPTDVLDDYGQRMHGFVIAPQTGNYTFWIATDDAGALYLGTNENPATARVIANVNGWTPSREWTWEPNQQSAPIRLEAGKAYYISALMKEGGGGDNLAVRWQMPDGTDQAPMVATNLLPWGTSFSPPQIRTPPANTTAVEGGSASFSVELNAFTLASYQWRRNNTNLPGATAPALTLSPVSLADHGARYRVFITNTAGSTLSAEAVLTVTPDVTRPALAALQNIGPAQLRVTFSEPVEPASATNRLNYALSGGMGVQSVSPGPDAASVVIATTAFTYGTTYTLTVSNVRDSAQTPNTILANSQRSFTAVEFAPADVGSPPVAGTTTAVPGGTDVRGGGDLGGAADAFQFGYQTRTGNFDVRVRVAALDPTNPFAKAGLMARETLDAGSRFAAALATPATVGSHFLTRTTAGANATRSGSFPANYPETWLRLARSGNTFTGYASFDGQTWTQLGTASLALPNTILLGYAVASADPAQAATARFRDFGAVSGGTIAPYVPRGETLGPSSRQTGLVISEVMYHPRERADGRTAEFIELYNADLIPQELTGHRISGDVEFTFPAGYVLPAGGFAVIARNPADLQAVYGLTGVLGPFVNTNNLPNSGGTVRLRNPQDAILLEVEYDTKGAWPAAADGGGPSLVLARPSYGEGDPRAWAASDLAGGSPGGPEAVRANPQAGVMLNEILAHTDEPQVDFIELYNHGNAAVDLSGCVLTDDPSTNRFRIANGTTIGPRSFLSFGQGQLGFRLSAAGETIFLLSSNLTRVLDAVNFDAQENGVALGHYPDGTPEWRRLQGPTPAAENAPFRVSDVVINELMYDPISGSDDDEFIELHNRTAAAISLAGWSFTDGVDFTFPAGASIPANGYVVVAKSRPQLLLNHPSVATNLVFGGYSGALANAGERLALAMPDTIIETNEFSVIVTNRIRIVVDEVTWDDGGRWGKWSAGLGSSLERTDPNSDSLRPSNWADSDESQKAAWSTIEFTGRLDNGADSFPPAQLQVSLQGPGECLVDNVEVFATDGANRVANAGFESGLTGWTIQGNHRATVLDAAAGEGGGRALRVRATGRGDTGSNRIRTPVSPALTVNQNATLRARVRWVAGWPEFMLRLRGNWLEAVGRMDIPRNLGSPGGRNSRAVANAGPAIFDVTHFPPVPNGGEAVLVTARLTDPNGIGTVNLRHRADPGSTVGTVAMRDDGTAGDEVAGDGIWTARIAGQTAGTRRAFRIEAADLAGAPANSRFPADTSKEALIRWGDEKRAGNVGQYRFWQRQADYDFLRSRESLANDNLDCTFIYGDSRVIYNAEMRGKGSPWHGGSVGGDYIFAFPTDDRLLGARDVAVVTVGNLGSDNSAQREQAAFWIGRQLGIATLHRRHVWFWENGALKGLYEDTEEPNGYYADRWHPDGPDGDLYKIEDWFEFQDDGTSFGFSRDATLERFTTAGGALKPARYRWAWRKRAVQDSANDYSSLLNVVNAAALSGQSLVNQLSALADVEDWMRNFALQHIVGNWDAYGYNRGKNAYVYKPVGGRFIMIPWDIDFVLGSNSDGPTTDVFGANDPVVTKLWNTPAFRRMYWRGFQDAVNGPLRADRIGPVLDARYAALRANGANFIEPAPIKAWVESRRNYLAGRLASEDTAAFAVTSNGGADFSTGSGVVTLTGTAPVAGATIEVNGIAYPVTWSNVRSWSLAYPLRAGANALTVTARDLRGGVIPGGTDTINVTYTGAPPPAGEALVINEIMYNAALPAASFIEIYNQSGTPFDLSNWRLDGVGFVFPAGSVLAGGGYFVIAQDLDAFRAAYGTGVIPVGVYPGSLQNDGERLRLVRPGATPDQDFVVDQVRYDSALPWPADANGRGPSLQLIDPAQDNWRVLNWGVTATNAVNRATPGAVNAGRAVITAIPPLWLNEVLPQNVSGAADRFGEREPWLELHNAGTNVVDLAGLHLSDNLTNLTRWPFPAGASIPAKGFLLVWADNEPGESIATELHANFRPNPTNGVVALSRLNAGKAEVLDYLTWQDQPAGLARGLFPDGAPGERRIFHTPTPGVANNPAAPALQVFINEWMPGNTAAVPDNRGEFDDWFELYNAGPAAADLSAYTLTDDLTRPDKFVIPNGTVIPPGGYLLVWADEQEGQTTNGHLHVSFRLSGSGEALGLFAPDGTPVDTLTFGPLANNVGQGRFPDGGAPPFITFAQYSPGQPNIAAGANQPPVLGVIGNRAVDEGETLTFKATATDPDAGQTRTFSLVGAPAAATINAATGDFAWTTTEADGPREFVFSVRVTDSGTPARTDAETITVTVREVNRQPALAAPTPHGVNEGATLTFKATGSDPDLPPQALTYSLDAGAPAGAAVDPVTGDVTWTPAEAQGPGSYTLRVRVTDNGVPALFAFTDVVVNVAEVDDAPVFDAVSLQTAEELAPFALKLVARDPDTPPKALTYSLDAGPSGLALNPATGDLTWTPTEAQGPGSYNVIARATEAGAGGLSGTRAFSIVVTERNTAPTLDAVPEFTVPDGTLVTFTNRAADVDLPAQKLAFTLDPGAPAGAAVDPQTGVFTWPVPVDAPAGTNTITVRVTDDALQPLSAAQTFRVIVRPAVRVVISEIMYHPAAANAEFIELANTSAGATWNLTFWRLTGGAEFAFPAGTTLPPGGFLVIARDLTAFRTAYGTNLPVVGPYTGALGRDGGLVRLVRPADAGEETVDEVAYGDRAPWPAAADGAGPSLQLMDPAQDNARPANWAAVAGAVTNPPVPVVSLTNFWRYSQAGAMPVGGWTNSAFNDTAWPQGRGLLHVEDAALPAPKNTALTIGRMTYYFRTKFTFNGSPDGAALVLSPIIDDGMVAYLNGREVFRLGMDATAAGYDAPANRTVPNAVIEGPFTVAVTNLVAGENTLAVEVHQVNAGSSDIVFGLAVDALETRRAAFTPGLANSVAAELDPVPALWINEVLPQNVAGATDNLGEREPWFELYNAADKPLPLDGLAFTDDLAQPAKWPVPAGNEVPARGFLRIWADGEPIENGPGHLHAGFRLAATSGQLALTRSTARGAEVLDHVAWTTPGTDVSWGCLPDGRPASRRTLSPTPGGANTATGDNRTPTITHPGDRTVDELAATAFDILAADPDVGQSLAWSLTPANLGAAVSTAGRFAWTPTEAQGPGVYAFTVTVQDNGSPALSTNAQFTVTVREANLPPTMAVIGDPTVAAGTPLVVNLIVTDPDLPAQALAFDFVGAVPAGTALDQANRRFTWTPAAAQAGEHTVTVRVTDNGAPARSASRTFRITVNPPTGPAPAVLGAPEMLPGGLVRLTWASEPGRRYRVEWRDALGSGAWTDAGVEVPSSGGTTLHAVPAGLAGTRYFRVLTLP
ncbi:MAG: lamin tail domain-containing protein [Limisphaerales bacterium]